MTPADFSINFALGLAGSLHCVQMCGPIVLSFGLPLANWARPRQAAGHILYHSGRIATYSLLGAVAGTFGNTLSALAPYQNAASLTAGAYPEALRAVESGLKIPFGSEPRSRQ